MMNDHETKVIFGDGKPGKDGNFLVVGIGASAGGIGALREFFAKVGKKTGVAYIVVLHLSPDHDSKLAEVLQSVTPIPVIQIREKTRIEPDHVYVVSPNRSLGLNDGHLMTRPIKGVEERRAPVDIFFRKLAETYQSRAVAVVLSGTGANGSMGLKRVKEFGGAAFVQNPREAEFNEMPRNSIATDLVDAVLPAQEIPAQILRYRKNIGAVDIAHEPRERAGKQQQALRDIFAKLRVRTGHDFSNYKRATILRRIERRIGLKNLPDIQTYASYLNEQPDEAVALLKDLLISVTNFFRDGKAFHALETSIFPRLLAERKQNDAVRIWVAGCATGEEAYSIAMIAAEQTQDIPESPSVQIFATDIDEQALAAAREGIYSLNDAADVSPARLQRFFTKEGDHYQIRREIREMVLFANHNLIKDPPFSHLDLFSCRNLMIYLNQTAQERILETIHFALKPGGYLFIGSSESVEGAGDLFAPVVKEHHIFQSRHAAARTMPIPESGPAFQVRTVKTALGRESSAAPNDRMTYSELHIRLLEKYGPPSIVVNQDYEIVHLSESAGKYLQVAGGEPSNDLMRMVHPDIRLELRSALFQAMQHQTNVEAKNVAADVDGKNETLNIQVRPVTKETDTSRGFALIIFDPADNGTGAMEPADYAAREPIALQLEEELVRSKNQLQSALEQAEVQAEELRASNEELQAMNEELRSSAEELETSKEELQSINEELTTVNQELKIKIEELSHSNTNFQNLINSIDIGVIFLDGSLRVKLFSPAARGLFNLIPNDVGRPLSDLTNRLDYTGLIDDAEGVLGNLQTVEREVSTTGGKSYLMRILPYRIGNNRIDGVVVAFFDITERKITEAQLRDREQELEVIVNRTSFLLTRCTRDLKFRFVSRAFADMINQRPEDLAGQPIKKILSRRGFDTIKPYIDMVLEGEYVQFEKDIEFKDVGKRTLMVSYTPDRDKNGDVAGWIASIVDLTDVRAAERALERTETRLRLMAESVTDYAMILTDKKGNVTDWSAGAEALFGWTAEEMKGRSADIIFVKEDRDAGVPEKERATAKKKGRAMDERWKNRSDGSRIFVSGVMTPLLEDRELVGFAKIARDLTDRIKAEAVENEREMLKRLVEAQEAERARIARDLHDQLGQQLTALRLKMQSVKKACGPNQVKPLTQMQEMAKQVDNEISFLAWELRPHTLEKLGLKGALGQYVSEWSKNYQIEADFHTASGRVRRLDPNMEINIYRIVQEALNNISKHAKASKATVTLEYNKKEIVLAVEDNGRGFDMHGKRRKGKRKSVGLSGMQERAALMGGVLSIESSPGKGTTVLARVPIKPPDATNGSKRSK